MKLGKVSLSQRDVLNSADWGQTSHAALYSDQYSSQHAYKIVLFFPTDIFYHPDPLKPITWHRKIIMAMCGRLLFVKWEARSYKTVTQSTCNWTKKWLKCISSPLPEIDWITAWGNYVLVAYKPSAWQPPGQFSWSLGQRHVVGHEEVTQIRTHVHVFGTTSKVPSSFIYFIIIIIIFLIDRNTAGSGNMIHF